MTEISEIESAEEIEGTEYMTTVEEIAEHFGHNVDVGVYEDYEGNMMDATLECKTCGKIIVSGKVLEAEKRALYDTPEARELLDEIIEERF